MRFSLIVVFCTIPYSCVIPYDLIYRSCISYIAVDEVAELCCQFLIPSVSRSPGAMLHVHDISMLSVESLVANITYMEHLYLCNGTKVRPDGNGRHRSETSEDIRYAHSRPAPARPIY